MVRARSLSNNRSLWSRTIFIPGRSCIFVSTMGISDLLQLWQHDLGRLFTAAKLQYDCTSHRVSKSSKGDDNLHYIDGLFRCGVHAILPIGRAFAFAPKVTKHDASLTFERSERVFDRGTARLDTLNDRRPQEFCRSSGILYDSRTIPGTNRRFPIVVHT